MVTSGYERDALTALKKFLPALERIADALEKPQPKAEENTPKGCWISVKDALPDFRLRVIILVPDHGENKMYKSYRAEPNTIEARTNNIDPNNFLVHAEGLKAAYWMFIPVLPNGGK